jgi:hypothetical protein
VAVAAGSFLLSTDPASAAAPSSTSSVQSQIDKTLRETKGGTQTGPNTISYNGGSVLMVFPNAGAKSIDDKTASQSVSTNALASTTYVHGCPKGSSTQWYCFYADVNWGGRMLQFKDCGVVQDLSTYQFQNQTSSWVNTKTNKGVQTAASNSGAPLWYEEPSSQSSWVGASFNDRLLRFICG